MSYRLWILLVAALLLGGVAWTAGEAVAGLSAYWAFDEGTGSTAYDATPNNNDGAISGATWTTGHSGSALYFHGGGQWFDGDCVTVPHSASLDITGPFEVEAWIKATGSDSYNAILDKFHHSGGFGYGFALYLNNGRLRLTVYSGANGDKNAIGTTDLRDDTWHRVAGVWDGTRVIAYVGGTPEAENLWSHAPAATTNDLGIGKRLSGHGGYLPFLGTIDEVYIYQNQQPECCFTANPDPPHPSEMVNFGDCSTDPDGDSIVAWFWDFGDGDTSTQQNPTHAFAAGSWEVCLTVTDDGRPPSSATCCRTIETMNQPPDCCFSYSPANPDDQTPVEFTDCSTDPDGDAIVSWDWFFGDGDTSSQQNPSHLFAVGTYEVCLNVTDDRGGSASCCQTITVIPGNLPPECCFSYDPPLPDHLTPVEFTDCSTDPDGQVLAWEWDFGDGDVSAEQNPSHQFAPGNWEVTLTVIDDEAAWATCTATVQVVPAGPPVPDLVEPIDPAWVDRRPPLTGLVTLHCTEATGRTSVTDANGNGDIAWVAFDYSPDGGMTWVPIDVDYDGGTPTDGGPDVSGTHYNWWSVDWDVSEVPYPPGEFALRATMEDTQGQSGQSTVHAWAYPATGPQQIAQPTEYAKFTEGSTIPLALGGAALVADWHWQPKQDIYLKGVPALSQYQLSGWPQSGYDIGDPAHPNGCPGDYFCAPVAWASCFLWWDAQPGYDALVPTEMELGQTPGPKKLVEELAKLMGTDCDSGTAWQDQLTGARQWIAARGVALHVSYYSESTLDGRQWWCKIYRNELENCKEDVLLSYITTLGGRHRVVGNGFDNANTSDYACVLQVMCPGYGGYRDAMMKPDDVPEGGVISFDSGQNWTPTKDIITASPDIPLQPWYLACPKTTPVPQSWNLNNSATWQDANTPMRGDSYYLLRADSTVIVGPNQTRLYADTIVIEITNTAPTCDIVFSPRDASDGKVWVRSPVTFISQAWDAGNPGQKGLTCQWDFGDGSTGSGCTTSHIYWNPGTYQVALTVTDDEGDQCTDVQGVTAKAFQFPTPVPDAGGWNIITLPCIHSDPWEVFDELRPPNKPMDLLSGNLHRYHHEEQRYATYYEWAPSDFGPLRAGDAYWLYTFEEELIGYDGEYSGAQEEVQFLTPGWYLMGSPQPFDTHLESTMWWQGPTGPMPFSGIMDLWVQDPLIGYDSLGHQYISVGLKGTDDDEYLRAFQGYWIYAFEPDLRMVVPPPPP